MKIKDYENILNSMQMTGVYVIREDNHQILYFNKRIKDSDPDVEIGMVCHELWPDSCSNCPLLYMGDKKEGKTIHYNSPFGKAVDMIAVRTLWEERIPAFLITVTPHSEVSSHTYSDILKVNLTTDSFDIVKESIYKKGENLHSSTLSETLRRFIDSGNICPDDEERLRRFVRMESLRKELKNGKELLTCTYRRKIGSGYRWHTMEIVPDFNYSEKSQTVMLYVKDIHDEYRKGMELEEINAQNQEIINFLGELNFGVYVIALRTGLLRPVRISEDMEAAFDSEILEWDDCLKRMVDQSFHPDFQAELLERYSLAELRAAWERGEKKKEMLCRQRIRGYYRYVSAAAYFYENNSGSTYVVFALQDVDENTRREIRRNQNDRRMAAIVKSRYNIMNTVYLDTGMCERIDLHKTEQGQISSGDYEHYVQKTMDEIDPEDRERFLRVLSLENLRKKAEKVEDFAELFCQYRIGKPCQAWWEQHVIFTRHDRQITVNILERDITVKKRREEAYTRERRERAAIINSMSRLFFAAYYIDLEQNQFQAVAQVEEAGNLLKEGVNYLEGISAYATKFVHPEDREEYIYWASRENLMLSLNSEHPFTAIEYRRILEKDEKFQSNGWIRATIVLADMMDGRPSKALYVAQDITEIKEKEDRECQALKEACDAANQANASKSDFLSRMSHDIRTPMNAIIGMTAIAGAHLDDTERVSDCLNKITVSSRHLLSLINEVLDMSKIESGKIDLADEEFNLSDSIQNLVTMIRPSLQAKEHQLEIHVGKVENENVIGDGMRLQQVFMNILGNAVKYTPHGGRLEMEIREKPSKVFGYGCYEFVFQDNGIGMSKDFVKRVFEPFSRAEDSRISKIEGTGLGMAIAQNIVHMMNGTIHVESEPDKGSKFIVTVFLKQQSGTDQDAAYLLDLPILVVGDDKHACKAVCTVLDDIGMKSEWALGRREAVRRVRETSAAGEDFFAVILDWEMPDIDGLQTAREIRKEAGPDVPIIILTAYDWSSMEEEARQVEIDGFLSKPLFKSKLLYLFKKIAGDGERTRLDLSNGWSEQDFQGRTILLAEDNELNREIAVEIIGSTGAAIECADNGREAVEMFRNKGEGYYDLIFMDIQMPVMNGYEAASAIRESAQADAKQIPIIAMTANAFAEDVMASKEAGMDDHIAKPLDIEQLMEYMRKWIG
ncbi:response regulator [Lachnospiraceae bacterium 62-35]